MNITIFCLMNALGASTTVHLWGDSALSQVIILALSGPIFWIFIPILDQNPNFILIPQRGPIRLDRKKARLIIDWKIHFFQILSCYPAIFYFISYPIGKIKIYPVICFRWFAGHRTDSAKKSKRAIPDWYRNLPTSCGKTSLRAFLSWIDGMALSIG